MTIRRRPSDFRVDEELSAEFAAGLCERPAAGWRERHAVYILTKTSLTTPEAVQRFAKAARLSAGRVDYAGLKDKHAETTQHVSAPVGREVRTPELMPREHSGPGWGARLVGWSERAVSAEAIGRNRFTIVVRDMTAADVEMMDRRAAVLRDQDGGDGGAALLVVNYFGDQRFGSARHGRGFAAVHLVRGEFEEAIRLLIATPARKDAGTKRAFTRLAASKWGAWAELAQELPRCPERRAIEVLAAGGTGREAFASLPNFLQVMSVEALQSEVWNATVRGMMEELGRPVAQGENGTPEAAAGVGVQAELVRAADDFGEMVFPAAACVPGAWRELDVPMLGAETVLRPPWGQHAAAALAVHGLRVEDLRIPGLRRPAFGEAGRPVFIRAEGFAMSAAERDEMSPGGRRLKRTVRFGLGRGGYATVVLRGLGQ